MEKERIIQYYDHCEQDYRLFWDLDHSHAMHAGYWDAQTSTLRQALRRENEILAEKVGIKFSDHVLDAGCGVGGSAIFLAQQYSCQVKGITLSAKQVETARRKAAAAKVNPLPVFEVMDYARTRFEDHTFDVVWGVESVCHAPDKKLFLEEAARVMKPGGRLIVADGFAMRKAYTGRDAIQMSRWLRGWGVDSLETVDSFYSHLIQAGFTNISYENITTHVIPSSRRLYWYSWPAVSLSKCLELVGLRTSHQTENLVGARYQYITLKRNLWQYGIFKAERP